MSCDKHMNYFKDENNKVFAYDDEQVNQGYGATLIAINEEEKELLINPSKTEEELAEIAKQGINMAIQVHLDAKAQEFRYDNMMSARSYTGFTNPFQEEAQRLAVWAANCWVKAGEIEADVASGDRPMPTVEEMLAELPEYVVS